MFKAEMMVDDNKVVRVMKLLTGHAHNLQIIPVKVVGLNSKTRVTTNGNVATASDLVSEMLRDMILSGTRNISTKELAAAAKNKHGLQYQNTMYAVKVLKAKGAMIRTDRGEYNLDANKL